MQQPRWILLCVVLSVLSLANEKLLARDLDWVRIQEPLPVWVNDCISRSNLLYVTGRDDLRIYDTSVPGQLRQLGSTPTGSGLDLALFGSTLLQASYGIGIVLFDVADPANPKFITTIPNGSGSSSVAVAGNYVLANAGSLFQVIDPSNVTQPSVLGQTDLEDGIRGIAVKANIAYVAAESSGLHLIDFQDPANPQRIGGFSTNKPVRRVLVAGDLAFADTLRGFFTFDVSDPRSLRELSFTARSLPSIRDWVVKEKTLFAMGDYDLVAYDLSEPSMPRREHMVSLEKQMQGLVIDRGTAYLGGHDQLEIISLTSVANPQSITNVPATVLSQSDIEIVGDLAYVTDASSLRILDISKEQGLRLIGTFTNQNSVSAAVGEEFVYLADLRSGITVIDVRDPTNPVHAGAYESGRSQDVFLDGAYLYVANFTNGLLILDINAPAEPSFVSQLALPGIAAGVVVSEEKAYVSGSKGLHIVDVRNKEFPQLLVTVPDGSALCAAVKGRAAYASISQNRLLVLDCSDPHAPRATATLRTRSRATGMAINCDHLYLAESSGGLEVFDISNPLAPQRVGGNSRYIATSISAASDRLYWATQGDGMASAYKFKSPKIGMITPGNPTTTLRVQGPTTLTGRLEFSSDLTEWFEGETIVFGEVDSELTHNPVNSDRQFYRLRAN